MFPKSLVSVIALVGGLSLPPGIAVGEETSPEAREVAPDPRAWGISGNCIDSHRMRNVRFVDDSSAIINVTGGKQVLMTLERRCPGIRSRGFLHETSINKLCTFDALRVIDTGHVCMIRSFEPYLGETEEGGPDDEPSPSGQSLEEGSGE